MTPAVIHTQGICKTFGDHRALKPLDMEVGQGRIVGLLGPNGAGKTTLLRMLTGITRPDEGELTLWGEKHHRGLLSRMGYLPEERGLYKGMRVAEQVLYFASLRGMKRSDAERELKGWFERLEVEGWWNREVGDLSKGMAQKVQFIATVLHRPELLILDEPFSGLDPINAQLVREEMLRLVREEGVTLLLSTHDMGSVESLCDDVVMLNQGTKVLGGQVDEIRSAASQGQVHLRGRGNLLAFVNALGAQAKVDRSATNEGVHELELTLLNGWDMPALLSFAVNHLDVMEASPIQKSMEEVFVTTVENHRSHG